MSALIPAALTKAYQSLVSIKISVNSPETREAVSKYWADCTKFIKDHKKAVTDLKKPFKEQIDEIDKVSKPMLDKAKELEWQAEQAILAYDRAERAKVQAQNQKKIEKYEEKVTLKEAEAINNGKPMPFVAPPALKAEPAKTVTVGDLKQTTVERKDWWLTGHVQPRDQYGNFIGKPAEQFKGFTMKDNIVRAKFDGGPQEIPAEYFVLDTAKVGQVIRAGGHIPGIDTVKVESLSGRAV
jgi:hypothetical protein